MNNQPIDNLENLPPKEQATIFTAESRAKEILDSVRNYALTYENFDGFFGIIKQAFFDLSVFINEVNYDVINEFAILPEFYQIMGNIIGNKKDTPEELARRTTKLWTTPKIDFIDAYRRLGKIESKSMTMKAVLEEILYVALVKVEELIHTGMPIEKRISIIRPKNVTQLVASLALTGKKPLEIANEHPEWGLEAAKIPSYIVRGLTGMIEKDEITQEQAESVGYKLPIKKSKPTLDLVTNQTPTS